MSTAAEPLFQPDGDIFLPSAMARGPWSRHALHGGATAALVARAVERHHDGGVERRLARLTVELLRPVPVAPLRLAARTVRPGRKVRLVAVTVSAEGVEVARALALQLRVADVTLPADAVAGEATVPGPPAAGEAVADDRWPAFHNAGCELRYSRGGWLRQGPGTVWIRLRSPVVSGEEPSPAQRAAAAADFGNGVSMVLPFEEYLFLNPDLTLTLLRDPRGEWVCLDAVTRLGQEGAGLAESAVYDKAGRVGLAVQTLLVEPRRG
jgi:hypothetical protein